ncbi:Protein bicaudal D [Fasciola hepatica]|uniref:Protein bicaudal D n=1 Tax=Fasciola hepatica TaxID=6192 RepID=A0A2H1BSQ5_FASHE|nr:Protein bicaudal D [Fasciola hepatica]
MRALKASNQVKREQVPTMRSMLRTNKTTAETALDNLKQKYEKEKLLVTGTMQSLRDELAVLKEESTKKASLRAMYSQRYDEYSAQIDEMQQKLTFAENERRTLNSLLRLVILQKLDLTQLLKDIAEKQEESGYFQKQQQSHEALQKYKAALYDLKRLEEKHQLQNQVEELEKRSEEVNRELKLSKRKLHERNEIQRLFSLAGFEEEQDMLSKYANKDQHLVAQVQDLEVELKDVKVKLDRQKTDYGGLHQK